jgi:hypothetical protein
MNQKAALCEQSRLSQDAWMWPWKSKSRAETQILTIHMKEGDAGAIRWAENIITTIVLEQTRGVAECVQNIVTEATRNRVMGGDTVENIFSYMSTAAMTNATLINTGIGNRVQDAHNSRQRYKLRQLRDCIHVMQMGTTHGREHGQASETEQVDYVDIAVAGYFRCGHQVQGWHRSA